MGGLAYQIDNAVPATVLCRSRRPNTCPARTLITWTSTVKIRAQIWKTSNHTDQTYDIHSTTHDSAEICATINRAVPTLLKTPPYLPTY